MKHAILELLITCLALTSALPARAEKFTFAVASDSRGKEPSGVNAKVLVPILKQIEAAGADLLFFPGDLVNGHADIKKHRHQLKAFKGLIKRHLKKTRLHAVMGNHDSGPMTHVRLFARMFPGPKNGPGRYSRLTYYVRWKGALFVVLSTDYFGELSLVSDAQVRWLEGVLKKNADARHVFVFGHQPAYPAGRHVGMSLDAYPERRDRLWALLRKHRVDAYFCGHEHFFNMKVVTGIYQVIVGSAGASLYRGFGGAFYHYALVTVDGDRVQVKVHDHKGAQRRVFAFKRRTGYLAMSLADVEKLSDAKIVKAIAQGAKGLAWKAAWVAGRRKLRAAIPALVKTGMVKVNWKDHDDAYFIIHGVRALGLMRAREGLPLVRAMLKCKGATLVQEAQAARRAILGKKAGKKR